MYVCICMLVINNCMYEKVTHATMYHACMYDCIYYLGNL
jgi:hypothetical protein